MESIKKIKNIRIKKSEIQRKRDGKIFQWVAFLVLTMFGLFCLYPFANVLLTSFSSLSDIVNSKALVIPYNFTLEAYRYILSIPSIPRGFFISVGVTFTGTILAVFITSFAAYPLSKATLPGKKIFSFLIIFTMFFGGGTVPMFILLRNLGFMGTNFFSLVGIVLPFCLGPFNVIILRNFFKTVPYSLVEAAQIDGAGEFRILFTVMMPLSMSGIVTVALFEAVMYWNAWFWPMLLIRNPDYGTLALVLRSFIVQPVQPGVGEIPSESEMLAETAKSAVIIVSIVPLVIIYPFIQRFFQKGIVLGAVKG